MTSPLLFSGKSKVMGAFSSLMVFVGDAVCYAVDVLDESAELSKYAIRFEEECRSRKELHKT